MSACALSSRASRQRERRNAHATCLPTRPSAVSFGWWSAYHDSIALPFRVPDVASAAPAEAQVEADVPAAAAAAAPSQAKPKPNTRSSTAAAAAATTASAPTTRMLDGATPFAQSHSGSSARRRSAARQAEARGNAASSSRTSTSALALAKAPSGLSSAQPAAAAGSLAPSAVLVPAASGTTLIYPPKNVVANETALQPAASAPSGSQATATASAKDVEVPLPSRKHGREQSAAGTEALAAKKARSCEETSETMVRAPSLMSAPAVEEEHSVSNYPAFVQAALEAELQRLDAQHEADVRDTEASQKSVRQAKFQEYLDHLDQCREAHYACQRARMDDAGFEVDESSRIDDLRVTDAFHDQLAAKLRKLHLDYLQSMADAHTQRRKDCRDAYAAAAGLGLEG